VSSPAINSLNRRDLSTLVFLDIPPYFFFPFPPFVFENLFSPQNRQNEKINTFRSGVSFNAFDFNRGVSPRVLGYFSFYPPARHPGLLFEIRSSSSQKLLRLGSVFLGLQFRILELNLRSSTCRPRVFSPPPSLVVLLCSGHTSYPL